MHFNWMGIEEATHMCAYVSVLFANVFVFLCVSACVKGHTHYVAEGFCAVDYSNDLMQVTWCMITYIHDGNELSFTRTRRVRK